MNDRPEPDPVRQNCSICSSLRRAEYASQKYGWPENDTALPIAANGLVLIRDFKPLSDRARQLQRCPECGAWFLYETDYEYLVNGSEDEQTLTRLTEAEAAAYLNPAAQG